MPRLMRARSRFTGFTLVELVIVMAVIALLMAIAIPSYRRNVQKSNRAVAKGALTQLLARQEQFFSDRKSYATSLTALGYSAATLYACNNGGLDCAAGTGIYEITVCSSGSFTSSTGVAISCAAPSATTVWLKATPINIQSSPLDSCGTLVASTDGIKGQNGSLGTTCWKS